MGRRGPKPKPKAVLKIFNSRRGKARKARPTPLPGIPACPAWLPKLAKAKFAEVGAELHRLGVLSKLDGAALAAYAVAWSELVEATAIVEEEGRTVTVPSGYIQPHPAVAMQRSALQALHRLGATLGLSPADRARLPEPETGKSDDPLDEFLRGKSG